MPERHSWAVGDDTTQVISTEDARYTVGALLLPAGSSALNRDGFLPAPGAPGQVTASATPDGRVHVAAYQRINRTDRGAPPYVQTLDAPKTIDVLATQPADPSNDRIDLIIGQQSDKLYGDANDAYLVRLVTGTPDASPSDPVVDGSPDWHLLAHVTVRANTDTIEQADIANPMRRWTVTAGGLLPVTDDTELAAITPYTGQQIYRADTGYTQTWDGSEWRNPPAVTDGDVTPIFVNPTGAWVNDTMMAGVWSGWAQLTGRWNRSTEFSWAPVAFTTFGSLPAGIPAPGRSVFTFASTSFPNKFTVVAAVTAGGDIQLSMDSGDNSNMPAGRPVAFTLSWPV